MNVDPNTLIPSGVNALLLGVSLWFIKHWMKDICDRLTRLENVYFKKEG